MNRVGGIKYVFYFNIKQNMKTTKVLNFHNKALILLTGFLPRCTSPHKMDWVHCDIRLLLDPSCKLVGRRYSLLNSCKQTTQP